MPEPTEPSLDTIGATFADFFREAPVGLKIINTENRVLYANQCAQDDIGRDEEELREVKELDLIHAADLFRFREQFRGVADGEIALSEVEARHRHSDGHWVPLLTTHMRLPATGWPQDWLLEISVDVSEQRKLKQQMMYLESKQLLGQMVRGIAHDFNNLLAVVSIKLDALGQTASLDEDSQRLLDESVSVVQRMTKLTKSLTSFGNAQRIETEQLEVNEAIRAMQDYFRYICPSSVSVHLHLDEDVPALDASPVQFEQILLNLVVNARDAIVEKGERGSIEIRTELEEIDDSDVIGPEMTPGRYARLSVHDDGIGMEEEVQNQIFEPFFSTKGAEGSGIGLSTIYAIVQQGRGYIDIQSERGKGTDVFIYLPAASSD